jgi:hypothetical protein
MKDIVVSLLSFSVQPPPLAGEAPSLIIKETLMEL